MTKHFITRMNNKNRYARNEKYVKHAIQLKLHKRMNKKIFEVVVTSYGLNNNLDDEIKNSRTSPDQQFKEFSLTKQKTRPRLDYEWIRKTI